MTTVKQADFSHGIPVVSSSADRDARYPAPDTNARVHNLGTGYVERYDGSQWVAAIPTAAGGQTFDIKAYGAVGDGTTDNTTAISKAIAAAQAAGGGIVSVPPGTFGHKGIVLSSGVSLIGAGRNSVLKRLSSATALLPVDGESVTDVEIAHLTFDSGFAAYSAAGVYGLYLNNATRVTVHHCWVTGYTENGIAVEGTSSRIQITNNHITADTGTYPNTASDGISLRSAISGTNNYGTPLAATVTDCVVSGNTITGGRWGISVTNAARCSLTGNTIRDQTDRNIILFAGTSYTTVSGNTCDTCGGTNIILSSGCLHNAVTGNVCRNANGNRGLSGEMIGIEAYYDSDYNTITGNTVESPGTSGIRVAYGSRFVSVVGNTVRGAGGSGILVAQGTDGVAFAGYVERDLTDVLVTGNAVDGGNAIVKVFRDVGTGYSRRVVVLANGGQNQTSLGYSFATTRDIVFTPTGPTNAPFGQVSVSDVTYSADAIREFDVRRFGAVGDGTTDDTAAWQAAVDAAVLAGGSNGGKVIGAPGLYKVTGNPFANQLGGGNVTIQVELSGAKLQTTKQIKIPTCTQVVGTNRLRNGIIADASFVPKATITAIARSANVVTVTTSSAHGLYVNATAVVTGVSTSSFNGAWTVASVPTSTTFTFAQTTSDASDSTGSVYIPLVVLGSSAQFSHGTQINNCAIDGNSLVNTVGLFSNTINELSGGRSLLIQNVGYRGLWIEQDANSGGSPNNYVFDDLEIYPLGGVSATGVYLRAATSGQHRGINNITVVPATNAGSNALAAGIDASGVAGVYSRLHFEGTTDGMVIGARGGTDSNAASGGSSAGIVVLGVTGNGTVGNCVRLANAAEVHDVSIFAVSARGATAAIKNDITSDTFSQNYVGAYHYGSQTGPNYYGTDPSHPWRINNDLRVRGNFGVGGGTANLSSISFGSFTLGAAASTVVSDANVTLSSKIIPFPTNAAAGTLMGSSKCLYISARSAGASFTVTTASGVAAAGTETFDYHVFN